MGIPESQLVTWSAQGATATSASTYHSIKSALERSDAPFANRNFEIFLQGSYGNHTNIYADSDIDIVICLTSTYYHDADDLSEDEKIRKKTDFIQASYSIDDFKSEVLSWLRTLFGSGVTAGNKALFVPGNGNRRDADVLVCAQHRHYHSYPSESQAQYWSGIVFWSQSGQRIVNYPKQHRQNCSNKNAATNSVYKPMVRVLKNMRNSMDENGYIQKAKAPSYFLEGMLSNVPNQLFGGQFSATFENAIGWLKKANSQGLLCANGIHWLVRDGHHVCWKSSDYQSYLGAAEKFWDEW